MNDIKKLKKVEELGWEVLKATGMIDGYGMIISARELQQEKQKQEEQENYFGR